MASQIHGEEVFVPEFRVHARIKESRSYWPNQPSMKEKMCPLKRISKASQTNLNQSITALNVHRVLASNP